MSQLHRMMKLLMCLAVPAMAACGVAPESGAPKSRVERQLIGFLEKFDRWDYNGDGYLDISELQETRERTGADPKDVLKFYDTNQDGRISMTEARAGTGRVEEAEARVAERR